MQRDSRQKGNLELETGWIPPLIQGTVALGTEIAGSSPAGSISISFIVKFGCRLRPSLFFVATVGAVYVFLICMATAHSTSCISSHSRTDTTHYARSSSPFGRAGGGFLFFADLSEKSLDLPTSGNCWRD